MPMPEFNRYVAQISELIASGRGRELETAQAVRTVTQQALANDAFIAGCAKNIIESVETARRPWRNPPLHLSPDLPLQLRIFYWPPGHKSDPHFHGKWTVTGVLYNEIAVETFESESDAEANQAAKRFAAKAGEVGYLLPPCIHRLSNPTAINSATMHVFSEDLAERQHAERPMKAALTNNRTSPIVQRALHVISGVLADNDDPAVTELLVRMFALAVPRVQVQVIKALISRDAELAYSLSRRLETSLHGADREKLAVINREFALACDYRGAEGARSASAGVA
jgi:predicted metal-dependent enzyme (double-stranded beta helix superfamily)